MAKRYHMERKDLPRVQSHGIDFFKPKRQETNLRGPANGIDLYHPNAITSFDLKEAVVKAGGYKAARKTLKRLGLGQQQKAARRQEANESEAMHTRSFAEIVRASSTTGTPTETNPVTQQFAKLNPPPLPPTRSDFDNKWEFLQKQRDNDEAELREEFRRSMAVEDAFKEADTDHSGILDYNEFRGVFSKLELDLTLELELLEVALGTSYIFYVITIIVLGC